MAELLSFIKTINYYLSDYVLVVLLVGSGALFTFKTNFVQIRCLPKALKNVFCGISLYKEKKDTVSTFAALSTAVAGQVGTGNIIGACSAVLTGGPGAVFWMWVMAFLSMATIYAEAVMAQSTKSTDLYGNVSGGPVYYIVKAFSKSAGRGLSVFFAFSTVISLGFTGAMVQSNAMCYALQDAFGIKSYISGLVISVSAVIIFFGGVKAVTSLSQKLVPVMAILYIIGCVTVLALRWEFIFESIASIVKYAFCPQAIIGGGVGYAFKTVLSQGVKRGLFSNEAGMGSTPHAHALADVCSAHEQGAAAMVGVFIDTFVILTLTCLVVVNTLYCGDKLLLSGVSKENAVQLIFSAFFGEKTGSGFVALSLLFFAFSSVISWNLFGRMNVQYLFKTKSAVVVYSLLSGGFIFLGSCLSNDLVWELSDMFNQFMVIPNVLALVALSDEVAKYSIEKNKVK